MTWLTRAEVRRDEPAQKALARLLLDEGARDVGHRLVWSLFAQETDARRDFLYREVEPGSYLILSEREPGDPKGLWAMQTKRYEPSVISGQRLGFALRANPAQSVKVEGRDRGIRVDAVMHAKARLGRVFGAEDVEVAALTWLFTRETRLGVKFDKERCSAGGYRQVQIGRAGAKPIRHSVIDYEGVLEVQNPDALAEALTGGVGKARAYGCGLLLLRTLAS
jgi:CRISPR system Cascade subunit CasE